MTEETRATCLKLIDRVFNQEYDSMFTQPTPSWQPTDVGPSGEDVVIKRITVPPKTDDQIGALTPQEMTMRKFCHYMFENYQDDMLAIVQAHREPRRKVKSTTHPYTYRRCHDESAVDDLNVAARLRNITIKGDRKQQVDSYGEYRALHLNYKSRPGKKMDISVASVPDAKIPTFVSDSELNGAISLAKELAELDTQKAPLLEIKSKAERVIATTELKLKQIEVEQRQKIRELREMQKKS